MTNGLTEVEFATNPDPRVPFVLVSIRLGRGGRYAAR
jgi:hypothetical protein